MIENWRAVPIPELAGVYSVSDLGHIRREAAVRGSRKGAMLSGAPERGRYLKVCLIRRGRRRWVKIHRLVLLAFIGPCPANKEVNHKNGDKTDNRLTNLEYVTRTENIRHAWRLGIYSCEANKQRAIIGAAKGWATRLANARRLVA